MLIKPSQSHLTLEMALWPCGVALQHKEQPMTKLKGSLNTSMQAWKANFVTTERIMQSAHPAPDPKAGSSALPHWALGFNGLEKTSSTNSTQSGQVQALEEAFKHLDGNCGALKPEHCGTPSALQTLSGSPAGFHSFGCAVSGIQYFLMYFQTVFLVWNALQFELQPARNTRQIQTVPQ